MSKYTVFLSYAQADDEGVGLVPALRHALQREIRLITGSEAEVFLDRKSGDLGDAWRSKIASAVMGSAVMVYMYSANYVQRQNCRDEFFSFQSEIKQRNVPGLLIPAILYDPAHIRKYSSEDEITRHVLDHNWIDFSEVVFEGPSSPEFRRRCRELAERIIKVVGESENTLVELETKDSHNKSDLGSLFKGDEDIFSTSTGFSDHLSNATEAIEAAQSHIEKLGQIEPYDDSKAQPVANVRKYLIRVSQQIKGPAQDFDKESLRVLTEIQHADKAIRSLARLASYSGNSEFQSKFDQELADGTANYEELAGTIESLEELRDSMRGPAAMSASIRRALQPAEHGISRLQDAIDIMHEWQQLEATTQSK